MIADLRMRFARMGSKRAPSPETDVNVGMNTFDQTKNPKRIKECFGRWTDTAMIGVSSGA
jgi:hypothetical protein